MSTKTIQKSSEYEKIVVDSCISYFKPCIQKAARNFSDEITHSLNQEKKSILPKFFYDKRGSNLFEKICNLPEYYLTRTEIKVLKQLQSDLANYLDDEYRLVELGSGASVKTRLVLDILDKNQKTLEYVPIDISEILKQSAIDLQKNYANLHIMGIIDTYESGLKFIKKYDNKPNLIAFLGSSFGNFSKKEGREFLKKIHAIMKQKDFFLIGLDLVKDKQVIEDAYNDSEGITAQFNLNVLSRINEELDGNFDLSKFTHHATYNENEQRIEMYLRSNSNQSIQIKKSNMNLEIKKNELIHTEHSHKYTISQIKKLFVDAGFEIKQIWQDKTYPYALVLTSKI